MVKDSVNPFKGLALEVQPVPAGPHTLLLL